MEETVAWGANLLLGPGSWVPMLVYYAAHTRQTVDTVGWVGGWVAWGARAALGREPVPDDTWQWVEAPLRESGHAETFDLCADEP